MAATKYDFSIEQGTSFRLAITYKDSSKNPIDITDYCARLVWVTNTGQTQVFSTENTDFSLYKFTVGGVHSGSGVPFRLNYAGIGYIFREDINAPEGAFVPPCPGDDHALDENTGLWIIKS